MKNSLVIKASTLSFMILFLSFAVTAQDLRFTQALTNPLTLNPALMGHNNDLRFNLHYRNQWGAVDKGFATYSFTALFPYYAQKDNSNKIDLGLNFTKDDAGAFNTIHASFAAGYNVHLSENSFLNFSAMGGIVQRYLDVNNLTFDEQYVLGAYEASNPNNEVVLNKKVSFADISVGAMWYTSPIKVDLGEDRKIMTYLGASAFHLNTPPNESFSGGTASLPRRYSFQGGLKVLGKKLDVTPNLYSNTQEANTNIAAGVLVDYHVDVISELSLGFWYRSKDAVAFCAGYTYLNYRLMYSYDIASTSPISNSAGGLQTHEVSLTIKFSMNDKWDAKILSFL